MTIEPHKVTREILGPIERVRVLSADGSLVEEHVTNLSALLQWIRRRNHDGTWEETYFVRRKVVTGDTYDKARQTYPDMPPSDPGADTFGQLKAAFKRIPKVPTRNIQSNQSALRELAGNAMPAADFIAAGGVLGTRTAKQSASLIAKLAAMGSAATFVTDIERNGLDPLFGGGIIVSMPLDKPLRAKLLQSLHRLNKQAGFDGPTDCGQELEFVRFD